MSEINNRMVPATDVAAELDEYMIEITTHIREDQAWALETLGFLRQLGHGVNFDRATLIREALDLLIEKYGVRAAKWPDKCKASSNS
ncbi:MAG TPA: hypothetical protein VIM99_13410 [Blastocatellia bacterium]